MTVAVKQVPVVSLNDRVISFIDSTLSKNNDRMQVAEMRARVCDKFDLNCHEAQKLVFGPQGILREKLHERRIEFKRGRRGGMVRTNVIQATFGDLPIASGGAPLIRRIRNLEDTCTKLLRRVEWLERQLKG